MANINVHAIKELRERTQAGMGECKTALTEADGDMDKAVEIILKKGLAKSAKRAGAIAAEGEVRAVVAPDGRSGVIVEVNVQTDFSARNELFTAYVAQVVDVAMRTPKGTNLDEQKVEGKTLAEIAIEIGAKLGEKVAVRRWDRLELGAGKHGVCHAYVHMGGKIAALLAVECETAEAAKHADVLKFVDETAMHIAATGPTALRREQIAAELVSKQREIFEAQLREDPKPKPEKMWPKIVDGKIDKWFSEVVLLEQDSVVVTGQKIEALRQAAATAAGAGVAVTGFARFERGEGIEKKKADLAADVASMIK
jgi:elongation factor Ts